MRQESRTTPWVLNRSTSTLREQGLVALLWRPRCLTQADCDISFLHGRQAQSLVIENGWSGEASCGRRAARARQGCEALEAHVCKARDARRDEAQAEQGDPSTARLAVKL